MTELANTLGGVVFFIGGLGLLYVFSRTIIWTIQDRDHILAILFGILLLLSAILCLGGFGLLMGYAKL